MDKEIWKDIEGYEGIYQVSNWGRVRSLDRFVNAKGNSKEFKKGIIFKLSKTRKGYLCATLSNGHAKKKTVHRLVAQAFIPNPMNKPQVNHIDGNKINNKADNLEWVTGKENVWHAVNNKLMYGLSGQYNSQAKLTNEQAEQIRKEYIPYSKEYNQCGLARKYGVSQCAIYRIIHNKRYKE